MDVEDMEVKIFKALAHPIRLSIVKKLRNGALCVCDMNKEVEFSQSNLSQHLKILRDAGLVVYEKDGSRINYKLKHEEILAVIDAMEKLLIQDIKEMSKVISDKEDKVQLGLTY